jgi:hypothetical protein
MEANQKHKRTYYFSISQGLRGCYMPDSSYIVAVKTRRELKNALGVEWFMLRDAGFIGCSKAALAWLSAEVWRNRGKATRDIVMPMKQRYQRGYPYGLFCSSASRADYLESSNGE